MGDAEAGERGHRATDPSPTQGSIEAFLLACCRAEIDADILVIGHHGSKTSSRHEFLDAVGAHTFVVSSGPTRYGSVTLPDSEVITELESRGLVVQTNSGDAACRTEPAKVGSDADDRAGGCTNFRIDIGPGSAVRTTEWIPE